MLCCSSIKLINILHVPLVVAQYDTAQWGVALEFSRMVDVNFLILTVYIISSPYSVPCAGHCDMDGNHLSFVRLFHLVVLPGR